MFREQYTKLNQQVSPDKNLLQDTIDKAKKCEKQSNSKIYSFRKPLIILVSLCLCACLAMPVLAATVAPVYQLMYMVSPTIAQFFMPVQKSVEDNGIKVEVVSAYIHDNVAKIYITMQDLTSDRIDETTDLFDSYDINRPFDSSAHCAFVDYDKSTKTATFLITIEEQGGNTITEDKITFTVREFISHKTSSENVKIDLDLADYKTESEYQTQSPNGGGSSNENAALTEERKFLVPESTIYPIMDNLNLSNIGFIDGKLHVQMQVTEKLTLDPHGSFYLMDENGNKVARDYNISYQTNRNGISITYDEFVFDVKKEDLQNYRLYGSFYVAGLNTKGNWQITFPLEQMN
ncbi:hypothetical protein ACIZ62_18290 [Acetobacterium carbinolicum]|uniref:hypothetical protein n=1 Tax=Acetobacterium carbinolicum TaxID=52690 RepID=UPI0039BFB279